MFSWVKALDKGYLTLFGQFLFGYYLAYNYGLKTDRFFASRSN